MACLVVLASAFTVATPARAQGPFLGEIRFVGFNFAPQGWASCDGQLMSISQNTALFSLLGTMYGGDGKVTFALPDLRGRVPIHVGQGPGLSTYTQGESAGAEAVTLTTTTMPSHDHTLASHTHGIPSLPVNLRASSAAATSGAPAGNVLAAATQSSPGQGNPNNNAPKPRIYNAGPADVSLASGGATTQAGSTDGGSGGTSATGGGQPHENRPPYLVLHCIIATQGIFPSRP
jgi:microcystin-dependent protein